MSLDLKRSESSHSLEKIIDLKVLEYFPYGISIAMDTTCDDIIHNPGAAEFLRLEPWSRFSLLNRKDAPFSVFLNGEFLAPENMPIRRAAWKGEHIKDLRLEFYWNDGVHKMARVSAGPLRDEKNEICGSVSTLEDITGDDQAKTNIGCARDMAPGWPAQDGEAALLFNAAFNITSSLKMIIRASDLTYLEVNQPLLQLYGLKREEIVGKTLQDFQIDRAFVQVIGNILRTRGYLHNVEVSAADDQRTFLVSGKTLLLRKEKCYFISLADVTQMNRLKNEMVRLEGLNALGKMAAAVGHEVRNPMSTVRGYLQMLELKPEYSMDRSRLDIMVSELDRANSLLTEFLSLVRKKPMDLQRKNINDIVRRLSPLLETDAVAQNKQIRFRLNEVPDIFLNEQEIAQLLINLCRNGLEAMDKDGMLTVSTLAESDMVMMSVQDEGRGIPNELKDKIGTPFFTTKERGTGLGLSICYNIVKRHNGYIKIESSPAGSTFTVCFPAAGN